MNCKPGDLAIVVRDSYGPQTHLGKIVTTVALEYAPDAKGIEMLAWATAPILYDDDGVIALFNDSSLRPIRPHGDDAVDQSKAWLPPVPKPERVSA